MFNFRRLSLHFGLFLGIVLAWNSVLGDSSKVVPDQKSKEKVSNKSNRKSTKKSKFVSPKDQLEHLKEVFKEREAAYTEAQAKKLVEELLPLVEKHAGKKFKSKPRVTLCDREGVMAALEKDLLEQYLKAPAFSSIPPERSKKIAAIQAKEYSLLLFGKYAFSDKKVYLLPKNAPPIFKLMKVDKKHWDALIKMVVVHELTHALQDQHIDMLNKFLQAKNADQMQAINAMMEGHAVFIQDKVASELGYDESIKEMARLLAGQGFTFDDPLLEMFNKMGKQLFEQIYLNGKTFISWQYDKGGNKRLWEIFKAPPKSTRVILNPELYGRKQTATADLKKALDGMEKDFGASYPWDVRSMALGQMQLATVYAAMDDENRKKIIHSIKQTQAFIATAPNSTSRRPYMANVSVIVFEKPENVKFWYENIVNLAKHNIEKLRKSPSIKDLKLSIDKITGIKADISQKMLISMVTSAPETTTIARYSRGPIVVEIIVNYPFTDEKLNEIAEKVFKRCKEAGL